MIINEKKKLEDVRILRGPSNVDTVREVPVLQKIKDLEVDGSRYGTLHFPRSWCVSDYSYFVTNGEFISDHSPKGNAENILKQLSVFTEQMNESKSDREQIRLQSFIEQEQRSLDRIQEEDMVLADKVSCYGLSYDDFEKLHYVHHRPGVNKVENVYIMRQKGSNIYKIGVSERPERRIHDLNLANPFGMELVMYYTGIGPFQKEKELHKHFVLKNVRSKSEWFFLEDEEVDEIRQRFIDWLEEDLEVCEYLQIDNKGLGMKVGPFRKWNQSNRTLD